MVVAGISGSLRAGSFNTVLLKAALERLSGAEVQWVEIGDLPLYNQDRDEELIDAVERIRNQVRDADALLIATPEYNHSISGVLKNAIDWLSRPGGRGVIQGTPAGMMGASPGAVGTARAQQHLKQILLGMACPVFPWAEFCMGAAHQRVVEGQLTDAKTGEFLDSYVRGFEDWLQRIS